MSPLFTRLPIWLIYILMRRRRDCLSRRCWWWWMCASLAIVVCTTRICLYWGSRGCCDYRRRICSDRWHWPWHIRLRGRGRRPAWSWRGSRCRLQRWWGDGIADGRRWPSGRGGCSRVALCGRWHSPCGISERAHWWCRSWGCFGCARDLAFSFSFDAASCAFFEAKSCRFEENLMSMC
jgi:hypothetical protein